MYERTIIGEHLLVFHCEFSSERAPKLLRQFRKFDRTENVYPELKFPECYLLKNGYKEFYMQFPGDCNGNYVPMVHSKYTSEYKNFRQKSKTWCVNNYQKQ